MTSKGFFELIVRRQRRQRQGTVVNFDYRPRLASIDVPALIITGARDFICAPVLAAMMHESIPGSRLVTMERSGHLAHLEEPEPFSDAITSFLADYDASRPG